MKLPEAEIIKAVYTLLNEKVQSGATVAPYELSYVQRVLEDGGIVELSTCFSDVTQLSGSVPVYSTETPTFSAGAYIYIYTLNTNEVGPSDSFSYSVALSVKCAIVNTNGQISVKDVNQLGNTVANLMQPTTFSKITVSGFSVINQQLQAVNYVAPVQNGSKYEFSVTLDWLVDVMEV